MSNVVSSLEDQGFLALASYESKLTLTEGLVLGVGAIVATGFAYAASKASKPLSDWSHKSTDFASIRRDVDKMLQDSPHVQYNYDGFRGRRVVGYNDIVDEIASNAIEHDFTKKDIETLLETKFWTYLAPLSLKKHKKEYLIPYESLDGVEIEALDEETAKTLKKLSDLSYNEIGFLSDRSSLDEVASLSVPQIRDALQYVFEGNMNLYDYTHRGHEVNPSPGILQSAMRFRELGLTPEEVSKLDFLAPCVVGPSTTPKDVEIVKQIAKKFDSDQMSTISKAYRINKQDRVLPPREELLKILSLDYVPSNILIEAREGWQYDPTLEDIVAGIEEFKKIPKHIFENFEPYAGSEEKVSDQKIWDLWQRMKVNDDLRDRVFKVAAIAPTLMKNIASRSYLERVISWTIDQGEASWFEKLDTLADLNKSGELKKIVDAAEKQELDDYYSFWDLMDHYFKYKKLIPSTWKTWGELKESIDLVLAQQGKGPKLQAAGNPALRALDRLAAKDPEWAISQYENEYKRGKRIAPLMKDVVDHVEEIVKKGDTVVIHGRDGELIYDLLMRRPGIPKSRVKYAITSRPLTTQASSIPDSYRDYLGRMVPKGAVHIDTGFGGSIPEWFDRKGYEVKDIRLVSAIDKTREIPVTFPLDDNERRDIVLSDLEHSSQRLDVVQYEGWGNLRYSQAAPGYHARKYGVYDALGIPRLRSSTPKTRYEEQKRLRIAVQAPARVSEEDVEVDEEAMKVAK